jgi:hypothetical protein
MAIIRTNNGYNYKVSDNDLAAALEEEERWARRLREALVHKGTYDGVVHIRLADEMNSIEARLGNYAGGTIFDHVRSIFDDAATRGFQYDLHFPQLLIQYRRYGFGEPPEQWVPPPDVQSRNLSPIISPASRETPPRPTGSPTPVTKLHLLLPPTAGSATRTVQTLANRSEALVPSLPQPESSTSNSKSKIATTELTAPKVRKGHNSNDRPGDVPETATKLQPGCSRCEGAAKPCWVLRKTKKKVACYGCRRLRMKCDLCDDDVANGEDAKEVPPPKKNKQPRPKDATTAAAPEEQVEDAGQYSYIPYMPEVASHIRPETSARLQVDETQGGELRALRKQFAELTKTVHRLEKRCSTMERYFQAHLLRTWEGVNHQTALIYEEVDGIREGLEVHGQRYGVLRDFSQRMDDLYMGMGSNAHADSMKPLSWETEPDHEESPPVEEALSPHPKPKPPIPITLPPVPLRRRGVSRKRSLSPIDAREDSIPKRQRAE